jgi:phenylpyruvate tautomerase PptA (4-oxalocrotonate tautomerase family)
MPYLRLDLTKTYPSQTKRELAARLCRLYADVMQTQLWRPNVGIAELGEDNLFHLAPTGWSRSRWCSSRLGGAARPINVSNSGGVSSTSVVRVLGLPRKTVLVEFTVHSGDEMPRDGEWTSDWTAAEASAARPATPA